MKKVLIIAWREYAVNVRRPGFIIMTLLVPLLGLISLLIATFFGGQASRTLVEIFPAGPRLTAVVDHSGRFMPILSEFQERYIPYQDETVARTALEHERVRRVLVIPSTYPQSEDVVVVTAASSFSGLEIEDSGALRRFFIAHLTQDMDDHILRERLADPFDARIENISGASQSPGGMLAGTLNFGFSYLLSILLIVTIFTSSGYLLRSVSEEKTSRMIEIILSSVTPQQLLAGKVLGMGTLGLTQVFVWTASAFSLGSGLVILLGVTLSLFARPEVFVLMVVFYILGFTVYAVLLGSLGALGADFRESQQISGVVTLIATIPMMLMWVFFSNPNAPLVRVLSWFPLTAPTMMMIRLAMTDVQWFDVAVSSTVLLVTIPLTVWLGAKVFRLGLLMYGKRPGVLEIVQLLRQA